MQLHTIWLPYKYLYTCVKGYCLFCLPLYQLQSAGNDAYQTGKYREAVEHYSNAIMRSIESRPFTAICLCNRAAAHQALGNVIDAIADCNLAIALDGDYMKVSSIIQNFV